MLEKKIYKGTWWKPGEESNKLKGQLVYDPSEEFFLELYGSFHELG